jgi:hypothetical protein
MAARARIDGEKLNIDCPACGQTNAITLNRLLNGPVCGSCKAGLSAPDHPVEASRQVGAVSEQVLDGLLTS